MVPTPAPPHLSYETDSGIYCRKPTTAFIFVDFTFTKKWHDASFVVVLFIVTLLVAVYFVNNNKSRKRPITKLADSGQKYMNK